MRPKADPGEKKRIAALDLGTNTFRILIADVGPDKPLAIAREQIITRLGGGYDPRSNRLDESSVARAMAAIDKFAAIIEKHKPHKIVPVATEIVRRAINGGDFTGPAGRRLGAEISVIEPQKEAALAFSGIRAYIPSCIREFATVDIGGGSTEWTAAGPSGKLNGWVSLPIGVVGLAENILEGDPPTKESLNRCEQTVRDKIKNVPGMTGLNDPVDVVIGTGGTATSLAVMDMELDRYDVEKVQNHRIPLERMEALKNKIFPMTLEKKSDIFPLEGGREDVIVPGIILTIETLKIFGARELMASDAGLLEGLLLEGLLMDAV